MCFDESSFLTTTYSTTNKYFSDSHREVSKLVKFQHDSWIVRKFCTYFLVWKVGRSLEQIMSLLFFFQTKSSMSGYLHCITKKTNLSEALRISTLQENSSENRLSDQEDGLFYDLQHVKSKVRVRAPQSLGELNSPIGKTRRRWCKKGREWKYAVCRFTSRKQ